MIALGGLIVVVLAQNSTKSTSTALMETAKTPPEAPAEKIEKSDEEWRKILTPEQYEILRKAGTEPAHSAVYQQFNKQGEGVYYCAGCGAELFSSNEKFDSKSGWPSFYDPSKAKNVSTTTDYKIGVARTEVRCAVCDGHLGHVFEGEGHDTPTDKRYCVNGLALKFVPKKGADEDAAAKSDPEK